MGKPPACGKSRFQMIYPQQPPSLRAYREQILHITLTAAMPSTAPAYTTGWVYNLHTAPSTTNTGRVIALATAFSAIALLCIIIRLAIRGRMLKAIGLDDVSATASMLLGIAYSAIAIYRS